MTDQTLPVDELFRQADVDQVSELDLFEDTDGNLYASSPTLQDRDATLKVNVEAGTVTEVNEESVSQLELSHIRDRAEGTDLTYD